MDNPRSDDSPSLASTQLDDDDVSVSSTFGSPPPLSTNSLTVTLVGTKGASGPPPAFDATPQPQPILTSAELMRAKATEINESPAKVPALDTGNIAGSAAFRNGNKLKHIKHTFDPRVTPPHLLQPVLPLQLWEPREPLSPLPLLMPLFSFIRYPRLN
jgi:hypothetical protein